MFPVKHSFFVFLTLQGLFLLVFCLKFVCFSWDLLKNRKSNLRVCVFYEHVLNCDIFNLKPTFFRVGKQTTDLLKNFNYGQIFKAALRQNGRNFCREKNFPILAQSVKMTIFKGCFSSCFGLFLKPSFYVLIVLLRLWLVYIAGARRGRWGKRLCF